MSYTYQYPMVSATATILLILPNKEDLTQSHILLARRGPNASAYPKIMSLPGGFVEATQETVENAAVRELQEETNIVCNKDRLTLFHVSSEPDTDPRCHVINVCFWVELTPADTERMTPGDDIDELQLTNFATVQNTKLAFNHNDIAARGITHWLKHKGR